MRLHAVAHGRVQGVFFRVTVKEQAKLLGLTGTVRNMPDGTVEIIAFGPRELLEKLVAQLEMTPGLAQVDRMDCQWEEMDESPIDFKINY